MIPKVLDDLVSARIIEAVRAGASRAAAAEAARVSRSSLHSWLRRGADGEEPYESFLIKVRAAEGELERELVTIIKKHSITSHSAACWLLERRFQTRWAQRRPEDKREAPLSADEATALVAEAAQLHNAEKGPA